MGLAAMPDVDAALADATRQVGPAQRYGGTGPPGTADASLGRTDPDPLATPLDLMQYENISGAESTSDGGATFQIHGGGQPGRCPNAIEGTDAQALLGRPPILRGEDERAYAELLARVQAAVRPKDILEEFWVRDVVDLLWETLRLRRMKASVVTVATRDALAEILAPIVDRGGSGDADPFDLDLVFKKTPAQNLAAGWYRREGKAVEEVEQVLREADLSTDVVAAVALRRSLDDVERIERMIVSAEARRSAVLREVARHRAAFAEDLRRSSGSVRDAEFTEVGRP